MIKIDIISGFLGAGKTTLLKKLLEGRQSEEKIVVIENEFGEVGIDGSILKKSDIEVREINSGCICCTMAGDLGNAIKEVAAKYKPDRIIVEPSGVGKLSDVIKACEISELCETIEINMLITVVDALKYQVYIANFSEFYENQIRYAKTIILSRTQKADNKKLQAIVSSIGKCNNNSNIITTPWDELSAEYIIAVAEQDASVSLEQQLKEKKKITLKKLKHDGNCTCGCKDKHSGTQSHCAGEFFDVWGMETPKLYDENELIAKLKSMGNEKLFGTILRAKGILQLDKSKWTQFDYVPGEYDIKSTAADYTGRLCVIGRNLNKEELCKLFME